MSNTQTIPPGAVLGILGDGQLGRMLAIAAARLGYRVAVLGPGGRESPAGHVAYWAKSWGPQAYVDNDLLAEFCEFVEVVLIEWENIPVELIERIETRGVQVCPSSRVLAVAQDRLLEKTLASSLGISVPRFRNVEVPEDLDQGSCQVVESILKTRRGGYDGKGQKRFSLSGFAWEAWEVLGEVPCILEEVVDLMCEVSVVVARSPQAVEREMIVYGPFENVHESGILRTTRYPVRHPEACQKLSEIQHDTHTAALKLARQLNVHGLLAVEFFVTKEGQVLFNEMAPRPHNSGHLTIECCETSQFEQYVRAACNLPWGSCHFHSSGEMDNILGEEVAVWLDVMCQPDVALHLYGKNEIKPGRKMGHITKRLVGND